MPYYKAYFRYVSGGKVKSEHTAAFDAKNKDDAMRRVIRGEKQKLIAVDKIVKV
jgi:hypothetical protein